jgi:transposase-like protein
MGTQVNSNEPISAQHIRLPLCPRCKSELDSRVPRGFFVKKMLFFLPLKRYICYKCQRKRYILHN